MDAQSYLQVSQALCAKNSDSKNSNWDIFVYKSTRLCSKIYSIFYKDEALYFPFLYQVKELIIII